MLYYTPVFSSQRGCEKTLKTHQKNPQPHEINVSMHFALIQPTRTEVVHIPTGKRNPQRELELSARAVPGCSTCRGTFASILEEFGLSPFPNPAPEQTRGGTQAE